MIKRILVPLDGSELSECALAYAVALAKETNATVHLVTVWEEGERALISSLPQAAESVFKKGEEHWETYLAKHAKTVQAEGVAVDTDVLIGDPAAELLHLVETEQPNVLVLASHGRSGLSRWRYGSVADKLAREAPVPTLVLGPAVLEGTDRGATIRRILVPLDGSPAAEAALRPALELANELDAEVLLARSLQWATQAMVYGVPDVDIAKVDEELSKATELYLSEIRASLKSGRVVEAALLHGPPADALISFAEARDVDLIVMTSRGRGGLQRTLLGSVADRLLQAPAPVLIIRPEEASSITRPERGRYCHACGRATAYVELLPDDLCRRCGQHLRACANCVYHDGIACMQQRPEFHDTYPGRGCAHFQFRETPSPDEPIKHA